MAVVPTSNSNLRLGYMIVYRMYNYVIGFQIIALSNMNYEDVLLNKHIG